jgi:hypothetical protein
MWPRASRAAEVAGPARVGVDLGFVSFYLFKYLIHVQNFKNMYLLF